MTIQERHEEVTRMFKELQDFYVKHFPPGRALTDQEWEEYIDGTWKVADQYKGSSLENLANEITMALSNDIERVDKAWRRKQGVQNELQKTIKTQ